MSKFLYLYRGPATPMEDFTPEQGAEQARAWGGADAVQVRGQFLVIHPD